MRTFRNGKYSWAIQRQGKKVLLRWGMVGGKEQSSTREARDEADARGIYQQLIGEKTRRGYEEVTPEPTPLAPTGRALEGAVVEDPDDLAAHMALADWLSEQPDAKAQARGEFIRVQLALEDESLSPAQRRKLRKRETELLREHERDWLGLKLADAFLDGAGVFLTEEFYEEPQKYRGYRRGWLDWLRLPELTEELADRLAGADCLRLLYRLEIEDADYSEVFRYLAASRHLVNLRVLHIDDCGDYGDGIAAFVARLPRIEEVVVAVTDFDPGNLFALKSLTNLRSLRVVDAGRYPLKRLATNPALGRLTHLTLLPGLVEVWDEPLIRLADVRALVQSPHLKALTHLTLARSDMGDKGVRAIVASGILSRLVELDLSNGVITDEGARALAAAPDYRHLKKLDVQFNRLSDAGVDLLHRDGLDLVAGFQDIPNDDGEYENRQLYVSDEYADDWE